MKQDVKLFINNELVDFSNELSMPFVYQLEDTNNPSIVKNSFTKTISIVGTKQNNKIFGNIYNFDREQLYSNNYLTGVYFNPSFRTPFSIYRNGELIEEGYMQLNTISIKNKLINYNITLYGGLGDFFYNLSYSKENESLTLADLQYGVKDESGNTIPSENEFDFRLNKDIIKKCWDGIDGNGTIDNFINFIPSYNGVYEDFDNNKVLINLNNNNAFTQSSTTVDDETYSTYNGYAFGELDREYTEWEMRDLRSYQQRPAIKLKKVIDACCNPINNGGYEVDLDPTFFNENNVYWDKAYIALPLFTSTLNLTETPIQTQTAILNKDIWMGVSGNTSVTTDKTTIVPSSTGILSASGDKIDCTQTTDSTTFDGIIDLQLFFKTPDSTRNELFDTYSIGGYGTAVPVKITSAVLLQLVVYDSNNNIIGNSNVYSFSNIKADTSNWINYAPPVDASITSVIGKWLYDSNSGRYVFQNDSGNTFQISIKNIPRRDYIKYEIIMFQAQPKASTLPRGLVTSSGGTANMKPTISGKYYPLIDENSIVINFGENKIESNIKITKQTLLKTENTPADYLLSYCKLFGLMFKKNIGEKKIIIQTRNNYFKDEVEDWNHRIDWSNDVQINPIIFDKKFYEMDLESTENYYLNKYKNDYSVDYGQKRINTNYNFNTDTQQLFEKNVFENSVSVLDNSIYYRSFYNSDSIEMPCFAVNNIKYKLFNNTNTELKTTDIELSNLIDVYKTVNWNSNSGYDALPKTAFFKQEGDKKTLSDINNTLLFFDGFKTPKDVNGNPIKFWLTDDISEMNILNNGKSCYIYTESENDSGGNRIAYYLSTIPIFLRYNTTNNNVINSWDFAVPKEIYIPNINYDDSTTIYNRFWSDFYADQLDINTKKVICNVNLNGLVVNEDILRKFYWFGNSLWILNKIDNYDINSFKTTKCEFIKVQNQDSYLKPLGFN